MSSSKHPTFEDLAGVADAVAELTNLVLEITQTFNNEIIEAMARADQPLARHLFTQHIRQDLVDQNSRSQGVSIDAIKFAQGAVRVRRLADKLGALVRRLETKVAA